ncbi:MAG: insulinase family protein [Acidobacteria bacterium]|nr:insulinase family protein [Acidobacteriota bacterium]
MLRLLLTIGALLLLAAPAGADDLIALKQKILANGVTVLVWERPSAGRVGTRMFYRVDVAAERPGTAGLTHMLEHFLFKGSDLAGTTDWAAEKAIAEKIERLERQITDEKNRDRDCFRQRDVFADVERDCPTPVLNRLQTDLDTAITAQDRLSDPTWYDWAVQGAGGTNSTASTGADWMKFDIDLPASKLELFMWTERARVERPVFRQFEAEREVVVNQIRGGDNRPESKFERALQSMTYEASPYGWSHWFSDITRATREDHWEIFHKYFIPQNAVIVVVGEVKADDVFRMAEAYWGNWQPGRPSPRLRTVEPPPVGQKRLTVAAAAGPRVAVNVPMPAAGHPDAPAFQVLGEVLSGEDGLLAKELVTSRQIATSARASGSPAKYPSHFSIRVDVRSNADLDAVEQGIGVVLGQALAGTISAAQLGAAAGRLTLGLARRLEEIGDAAVTIGAMESIHHAGYLNALPSLWASVTAADLARVSRTYFGRDMQTVGVLRRETPGGAATVAPAASGTQAPDKPASSPGGAAKTLAGSPALNGDRAPRAASVRDVSRPAVAQLPDPLAIAENPWNAPSWLAGRRLSRFEQPAPTIRHTQLKFSETGFTPPSPAKYRHTLPNGIRSFVVPEPLLPMAQMTVLIDAPALADPAGKEGLASLLANILRRTGTATTSRREIEQALDRLNAVLTISADQNGTRVHVLSPPEAAAEAVSLIGDLVLRPDLSTVFEAERDRLAIAAGRAGDSPLVQARQLFDTALYGADHRVARRPTPASVRAVTLEDVRQLHRSRYRTDRIVLAISGHVERGRIERAIADTFGTAGTAGATDAPASPAIAPPKVTGRVTVTKDIDIRQGHVLIGHAGILGLPDDHAALEVMNYILSGGGFVSRMMKLLRTDTGITSALSGSVEPGRGVVNPYLWRFSGRPETIAQGVRLSLEQLARMREGGVTAEEFQAARTAYLDGLVPASYETAHETAVRLATKALFGLYDYQAPQYLNYYAGDEAQLAALRKLTREDVNRAARKYLDPANLVIAVAGPLAVIRAHASAEERALLEEKR